MLVLATDDRGPTGVHDVVHEHEQQHTDAHGGPIGDADEIAHGDSARIARGEITERGDGEPAESGEEKLVRQ